MAMSTAAFGGAVVWINADTGTLYFKDYPTVTTPVQAVKALVAGPGATEMLMNLTTAIPRGTSLKYVQFSSNGAIINLSGEAATGLDDMTSEMIFRQFMYTLRQFGLDADVRVLVDDQPISSYLKPVPEPLYSAPVTQGPVTNAVGLSGKRITLSPGHGLYYTGSYWTTQRGGSCGNEPEDYRNLRCATYLKTYLENDGAYVQPVREVNMGRTGGPGGAAWWQYAAYAWLRDAGYSCSVYASSSGVCSYTGTNHSNDDIRARPLASNLDSRGNTDIYVSIHTNAFQGDCHGSSCPSGTDCFYTSDGGHEAWASASINLAQKLHDAAISSVNSAGETRADGVAWGCHGSCSAKYGNFGETRIPSRPAALIELGFHDSCSTDAPKMEEPFFQSVMMWGMYNGICQYFGNTPTWGMYSAQVVSNTIPASMHAGTVQTVSVTMRNKGVLWDDAHGFRLGAVGDSDPFAGTRQSFGGATINNNGTFTFTFSFTAPATPGTYTTDWRMLREGHAWFGDTLTKQVVVVPNVVDIQPPTTPANLIAESTDHNKVHLSWSASTDNVAVASYEVFRNGGLIATVAAPTTTYDETTLTQGTTYSYQVRAKDTSSNYSAMSNTSSTKTWSIIAQTSFPNLTGWTAGRVADGTYRGVSLDGGVGSTLAGGSGAPSARTDIGSAGTNGSYSYLGFAAPFAVGYIECSFNDTAASNNSRQGISFRKFQNDDPANPRLVYFLGCDSAMSFGYYSYEVFSASALWTKVVTTKARSIGWHRFRISIDGSNVFFSIDGTQVGAPAEPVEGPEGCNRFYIGHNYNVNQTGWYDDFLAVFPSPPAATMGVPSAVGSDRVTWNYVRGNKNWEQGFYIRDTGGALKATGVRGSTSVTETGIPANTTVTRTVSAFNGTLESIVSAQATVTTLSVAPTASNIVASPAKQVWTNGAITFTSTVPFGPGGVQYYRYQFDQSPTYTWTGDEPAWNSGDLQVSGSSSGNNWYLHLKGFNSEGVANGTLDLGPFYCDASAPTIGVVTLTPSMAAVGDSVRADVTVADDIAVTSVTANDTPLTLSGGSWSGSIAAAAPVGVYNVTVVAKDAANNQVSDVSASYRSAAVLTASSAATWNPATANACGIYLFKFWGKVTEIDDNSFTLSDGGSTPITVHAPGYRAKVATNDYATARGILSPTGSVESAVEYVNKY